MKVKVMNKRLVLIPVSLLGIMLTYKMPHIDQIEYKNENNLEEVSASWDNSIQLNYLENYNKASQIESTNLLIENKEND